MRVYSNFSFWKDGRKIGTATSGDYTLRDSGDVILNDDGWDGVSRGINSSELSVSTIVPIGGDGQDFNRAKLRGEILTMTAAPVNGERHTVKMVLRECSYKTDMVKRTIEGSFKFEGGTPEISDI